MEAERGGDDDGPFFSWLPPDDRLWRHPSEVPSGQGGGTVSARSRRPKAISEALNAFAAGPGRIWTVAVIAGLVGATAASGIGIMTGAFDQQTTVLRSVISPSPQVSLAATDQSVDWSAIEDSTAPSVVSVAVSSGEGPAVGSGLVIESDAYGDTFVVTDSSLFTQADTTDYLGRIDVTFQSGSSIRGRLLRQDPLSGLAVIEVTAANAAVPMIGSIADVSLADQVLVVEGPNTPGGTVLTGAVSAEDQTVPLAEGTDMDNLVAVGGAVGASGTGGPVVDQYGQVVGVTVNANPLDPPATNLTYAVPIDEVERVAAAIIAGVAPSHPWVGVADTSDLPSAMARQLGLSGGARAGLVLAGSPASRAGISTGDVITSFDGHPIDSAGNLVAALYGCQPGHVANISFVNGADASVRTTIEISDEPDDS